MEDYSTREYKIEDAPSYAVAMTEKVDGKPIWLTYTATWTTHTDLRAEFCTKTQALAFIDEYVKLDNNLLELQEV